ncbi:MAG: hypothetical protein K6E99_03420, partial [Bacilli bacterium]|nr:hypothetical protein [Bacilli bacterium]
MENQSFKHKKNHKEFDLFTREYLNNPELFSDIFNAVLFNGENKIDKNKLYDTSQIDVFNDIEKDKHLIRERDLIKICKSDGNS